MATSAATSVATSTMTSTVTTTVTTSTATSAATSAATSTASQASTSSSNSAAGLAALPDSTVITFADPAVEADVLFDMHSYGPITLGDIRNYSGSTLTIGTTNVPLQITTSLAGMQYLQCLPKTTLIDFYTSLTSPTFDLTPLEGDRFGDLTIDVDDMAAMNLQPLLGIDPSTIVSLQLNGSTVMNMSVYQGIPDGMTNSQLAEIAPWLTAIDQTSTHLVNMNLSDNSLTDFSSLSGFTKPVLFSALGQRVNYDTKPVFFVDGQPGIFTALPLTAPDGTSMTSHYAVTLSGSATQAANDTTHHPEVALTSLGNGEFEIPTPYQTVPNANWFAYGLSGYYNLTTAAQLDTNFVEHTYPNGTDFEYDIMVYQPAYWLTNPEVAVEYVDAKTGAALQPTALFQGTTIGSAYDLTPQTKISGYSFDAQKSSSPTGTYTQDPQALTFTFAQEPAAPITVNYIDMDGNAIAPSTTINGYVGAAYQSQPLTVAGYTLLQAAVLPTTVPTSGTLSTTPGKINYVYNTNTLTRTIQYFDVTTGRVITANGFSEPYKSTTSYDPATQIANYEAEGYQLVADNYPTTGSLFGDPTPTKTYEIELAHKTETLTPTTADLPTGVTLQNDVTRTISYVNKADESVATPTVETITFNRNAVRDMVTGDVTYGPWVATNTDAFGVVTPPMISNFTPNTTAIPAEAAVAETTPDEFETVTYSPVATSGASSGAMSTATSATTSAATSATTSAATSATTSAATSTATSATTSMATSTATSAATSATTSTATSTATSAATSTTTSTATSTASAATSTTPKRVMSMAPAKTTSVTNTTPTSEVAQPATPTMMTRSGETKSATMTKLTAPAASESKTTATPVRLPKQTTTSAAASVKLTKTANVTGSHQTAAQSVQQKQSGLPQTNEQSNHASLLGLILVALVGFFASLKRLFKREF
ncbi:hypothetical protein MH1LPH_03110 [Lactiplantibacillus brownii]